MRNIILLYCLTIASALTAQLDSCLIAYYPFAGNTNDFSGNGLHGTNVGATLTNDRFGNPNAAYEFHEGDFIDLGSDPLFDITEPSITISAWVYKNMISSDIIFFTKRPNTFQTPIQYQATWLSNAHPNNPNQVRLNLMSTINGDVPHVGTESWHFAAVTYDGDSVKFYFDGILDRSVPISESLHSVNFNAMIGTDNVGNFSDGKIDEVRLYCRALSENEVLELYNFQESPLVEFAGSVKIVDGREAAGKVLTSNAEGIGSWKALPSELPANPSIGDMIYWDGATWVKVTGGFDNYVLTYCNNRPLWTIDGQCP